MPSELKSLMSLTAGAAPGLASGTITEDWTASKGIDNRYHTIGTSEESITFTDIGTVGWVHLYNADATNYVEVGFSTGVYGIKLKAADRAQFRLNTGATIYLKANTASCRVQVMHVGA